jgi:hypothetical protein
MREITGHKVNGCNESLTVTALDKPGAGGACHLYVVEGFNTAKNPSDPFAMRYGKPADHATILFQNGPIGEAGVNGITHEVLLAILIDRLEGFQAGKFACSENALALQSLKLAQNALQYRTQLRVMRGVEGTHTK